MSLPWPLTSLFQNSTFPSLWRWGNKPIFHKNRKYFGCKVLMISKEIAPKLQITIQRQVVTCFNESSSFPCQSREVGIWEEYIYRYIDAERSPLWICFLTNKKAVKNQECSDMPSLGEELFIWLNDRHSSYTGCSSLYFFKIQLCRKKWTRVANFPKFKIQLCRGKWTRVANIPMRNARSKLETHEKRLRDLEIFIMEKIRLGERARFLSLRIWRTVTK